MKKIIYSLVIMIAASTLFTSCLEYVEPVGIQQLRTAKADYLDALAQLRLADAELQKANATFVLAQAAFQDALTEAQLIQNRIAEYDVQIKAAQTELDVDQLKKQKELLQIQHADRMANAKAALALAEENLRVTLRDIAAVQHLLTAGEQTVFQAAINAYELALTTTRLLFGNSSRRKNFSGILSMHSMRRLTGKPTIRQRLTSIPMRLQGHRLLSTQFPRNSTSRLGMPKLRICKTP